MAGKQQPSSAWANFQDSNLAVFLIFLTAISPEDQVVPPSLIHAEEPLLSPAARSILNPFPNRSLGQQLLSSEGLENPYNTVAV